MCHSWSSMLNPVTLLQPWNWAQHNPTLPSALSEHRRNTLALCILTYQATMSTLSKIPWLESETITCYKSQYLFLIVSTCVSLSMCLSVHLCLCVCDGVYVHDCRCLGRPEKGIQIPWNWSSGGCESLNLDLNTGPLQKKYELLSISADPNYSVFTGIPSFLLLWTHNNLTRNCIDYSIFGLCSINISL